MALGFDQLQSYMNTQVPQQNQYLQGNPAVSESAQTSWMDDTDSSSSNNTGNYTKQPYPSPSQPSGGLSGNGTALGAITSGGSSFGSSPQSSGQSGQYMPEGYDLNKFNDPANANSTKYQVGRILSQYPPGPAGLQQASGQLASLGIRVEGGDRLRLPDGTTVDVGRAFSDPNASHAWQYNWSGPMDGGQQQPQSYMNTGQNNGQMQNQNWQMFMNNMMNQQFQAQQGQRRFNQNRGGLTPNPQGGYIPPSGGFSGYEAGLPDSGYSNPNIVSGGISGGIQQGPNTFDKFPGYTPGQQPTPDANGYYGGWQDETGLRHSGNQPGMSYML